MNYFSLIIIVVIFGGMMFFMNRQQKKQREQRQTQLNSMQPGAEIITIGGLHGVLTSIDEAHGTIELDCEGVILTFDRAAVKTIKNAPTTAEPAATETTEVTPSAENPIEEN